MRKIFTLAAVMASSTLLSACWLIDDNDDGVAGPRTATYQIQPVTSTGFNNNAANAVYSNRPSEAPNNLRYEVQFNASNELVIEDTTSGGKTYTFTEADLVNDGTADYMSWMKIFQANANQGDWVVAKDGIGLSIHTPAGINNEFALLRLVDQDAGTADWMLVGAPTATALTGTATYTGGYYSNIGNNPIELTANFANSNNAIDVTISRSDYEVKNNLTDALGANSISFTADYDSATNTITGTNKVIDTTGGSHFDRADIHGGFFNGGDTAAGLINLDHSANPTENVAGGFHATK